MPPETEGGVALDPWHHVTVDADGNTWRLDHPRDCDEASGFIAEELAPDGGLDVTIYRCLTQWRMHNDDTQTVPRTPGDYIVRAWWVAGAQWDGDGGLELWSARAFRRS